MNDTPVIAATYPTLIEAELAQAALADAGIEAFLQFDDVGGMIGSLQTVAGVKVLVDAASLDEARLLLSERAEPLPPEP